jgi:lipopolysaccharide export system protein LptA
MVLPATGFSASENKNKAGNKAVSSNLHVISDEMIAEQSKSMVEFIGNVKATREDSVLTADSVKVYFHTSETKKQGQGNVKKIVATGHVEYTGGERKAYADKAVYTTGDEILVLTGQSPKLLTGKSWITGRKITLYRLEERVLVESGGQKRVQAFFDSQDQNQPTLKSGKKEE